MKKFASLLIAVGIVASPAWAGESDVTKVQMRAERAGTYNFAVTLRHADVGLGPLRQPLGSAFHGR